jgi:hypothetical protein
LSKAQIVALLSVCKASRAVFQPYMYRYVNLVTRNRALHFFQTLAKRTDLQGHIKSLQFSFDLRPLISFRLSQPDCETPFWVELRQLLPKLCSLVYITFSFANEDGFFLRRILTNANLVRTLPPKVHTLHLKPLYARSSGNVGSHSELSILC